MKKVDVHLHLLPELDDGAQNIDVSAKMVDMLLEQGINAVILTSHYYSTKISLESLDGNFNASSISLFAGRL